MIALLVVKNAVHWLKLKVFPKKAVLGLHGGRKYFVFLPKR